MSAEIEYEIDANGILSPVIRGKGGRKLSWKKNTQSAEARQKIGEASKKRKPFLGKHHSEESRARMSESRKKIIGEDVSNAKLKEEDVREIKKALLRNERCSSLAKKYRVSFRTITLIRDGKRWSHVEVQP